jgi:hypothetical protein
MLFKHDTLCALALAFDNAGNSIAARIAMMAITTKSSISVKARSDFEGADLVRVTALVKRALKFAGLVWLVKRFSFSRSLRSVWLFSLRL